MDSDVRSESLFGRNSRRCFTDVKAPRLKIHFHNGTFGVVEVKWEFSQDCGLGASPALHMVLSRVSWASEQKQ